ncbi:hypothetical protein PMZ80_008028 [Knufia obscura]|uniref:Uncharacterized protein n=1 Tax=Knufia obscura TaxID=1635080 RepID=A0ABR0RHH5_9EURO|nr:hypothetical protein PMZ80_008028 [Knufia obscura]
MPLSAHLIPIRQMCPSNIQSGDSIHLPANIKDLPPITITWPANPGANPDNTILRKASYIPCNGYVYSHDYDRIGREVLVFIAAETLADSYLCIPSHLAKKWIVLREDVGPLKSKLEKPPRCIGYRVLINEDWQYGRLGNSECFVVYHPQSRMPYTHLFTTAVLETPGTLEPFSIHPRSAGGDQAGVGRFQLATSISPVQTAVVTAKKGGEFLESFR